MKPTKLVGILVLIAGALMVVSGGLAWGVTSSQLAAEKITVPEDSEFMGGAFRGKQVAGPLTAFAQAETIRQHTVKITDKTFAELGTLAREAEAAGDTAAVEKYNEQRTTVQTVSFLRASLFTSVLAFGISLLVMGAGLLFGLIGWALTRIKPATLPHEGATASASPSGAERPGE